MAKAPSQRLSAIADAVLAIGITPLEVMLEAMRQRYDAGDLDGACAAAKDAAPYCHPRLNAIDAKLALGGKVSITIETGVPRAD